MTLSCVIDNFLCLEVVEMIFWAFKLNVREIEEKFDILGAIRSQKH